MASSGQSGAAGYSRSVDMTYLCTGRTHPERAEVSFGRVKMTFGDGHTAVVSCDASQVTVVLDSRAVDGWVAAQIMATNLAGVVVGALGFSLGSGYTVEILQVTEPDGSAHVFGVRPGGPEPSQTLAAEAHQDVFNRATQLSARDVFFRLAVRDYLRAIIDVGDCPTYCYRAIESIKSAFVFKTGRDSWEDLHAALKTDRATITSLVKNYADPVRHGNWIEAKPTNSTERWNMLQLTRDILTKYLEHVEPAR